jgi:hypothetical protein
MFRAIHPAEMLSKILYWVPTDRDQHSCLRFGQDRFGDY